MDKQYVVTTLLLSWQLARCEGRDQAKAIRETAGRLLPDAAGSVKGLLTLIIGCQSDAKVIESQRMSLITLYIEGELK